MKENLFQALDIMWKGVLSIFIVIAIIICVTLLTNFIINKSIQKKDKNNKQIK